jgi:hypothetical protein
MVFDKRLRDGVRRGEITCSIRIWMRPHVKVGGRYPMGEGEIVVDSITLVGSLDGRVSESGMEQFPEITPELVRESGFPSLRDLLAVAKHGKGDKVFLVRFHYEERGGLK